MDTEYVDGDQAGDGSGADLTSAPTGVVRSLEGVVERSLRMEVEYAPDPVAQRNAEDRSTEFRTLKEAFGSILHLQEAWTTYMERLTLILTATTGVLEARCRNTAPLGGPMDGLPSPFTTMPTMGMGMTVLGKGLG